MGVFLFFIELELFERVTFIFDKGVGLILIFGDKEGVIIYIFNKSRCNQKKSQECELDL